MRRVHDGRNRSAVPGAGMSRPQPNNPLHGVTLEMILTRLVERYGWDELGRTINIKCFTHEPGIKSSLKFLRKTPWAREKVEALYLRSLYSKD
jgi:uncharacterized protein (DUF2132 family)